ncbi:MAG: chemotaxis response regulator protein-glutamate methylesterase [bacterium]
MRKALSMMLESDPEIKVIGTARDGSEGVEKARLLKPDLVTMDIEMPRMDGLTALRQIMTTDPVPVMMVSSLTTDGAQATLEALEMGAVDFIPKQLSYVSLDIVKIKDELVAKIKDIVHRRHILMARFSQRRFTQTATSGTRRISGSSGAKRTGSLPPAVARRRKSHLVRMIGIGSSTGGPPALQAIIPRLPRNLPVPVVIAQHMPPAFTKSLAERLDGMSLLNVREATHGEPAEAGTVLIAPGGKHMTVKKRGTRVYVEVSPCPAETLYHPCVDILMDSVADVCGATGMGVILTGMGSNGVVGLKKLKDKGGVVIAQNEQTCIVYGMPRAVIEANLADHVASLDNIAGEVVSYF